MMGFASYVRPLKSPEHLMGRQSPVDCRAFSKYPFTWSLPSTELCLQPPSHSPLLLSLPTPEGLHPRITLI